MSNFTLNVEILAGTGIKEAIEEAKEKCVMFDLAYVCFKFNGVSVSVGRHADVDKGIRRYSDAMKEGKPFFIENGN